MASKVVRVSEDALAVASLPFASSSVLYSFVRSTSDSNLNVQMVH